MLKMPDQDFVRLKSALISLLPEDGTPVLNRSMLIALARKLEREVDQETFFDARDQLFEAGLIGRSRGQGGKIFLADQPKQPNIDVVEPVGGGWTEAKLMKSLETYLQTTFRTYLDLPSGSAYIVRDTSVMSGVRGRWARPDFIAVTAMRFKYLPGAQVDVHSFELKTETGGSVLAIHEALAQTRFTHFGHFVWHLPNGSRNETMLDDIVSHCEEHGIGLIRIRDPERADTFEILADPERKPTLPGTVDGFLEGKLSAPQKQLLAKAIAGDTT